MAKGYMYMTLYQNTEWTEYIDLPKVWCIVLPINATRAPSLIREECTIVWRRVVCVLYTFLIQQRTLKEERNTYNVKGLVDLIRLLS